MVRPSVGDEQFTGRLCIPYLSRRGGVKLIKYRSLDDGDSGPKMTQYDNQTTRLYNTNAWFAADDQIVLCEGEIDAICATERLGLPAMAVPGAQTWAAHAGIWRIALKDFRLVLMIADGDPPQCGHNPAHPTGSCPHPRRRPGRELAKAVAETIGWRVRIIECPENQDISSMVAAGRERELLDKIAELEKDDDGSP